MDGVAPAVSRMSPPLVYPPLFPPAGGGEAPPPLPSGGVEHANPSWVIEHPGGAPRARGGGGGGGGLMGMFGGGGSAGASSASSAASSASGRGLTAPVPGQ